MPLTAKRMKDRSVLLTLISHSGNVEKERTFFYQSLGLVSAQHLSFSCEWRQSVRMTLTWRKRAGEQPWLTELICSGSPSLSLAAPHCCQ
jgi:hypothetical protein